MEEQDGPVELNGRQTSAAPIAVMKIYPMAIVFNS
jgi:hypothetical protein